MEETMIMINILGMTMTIVTAVYWIIGIVTAFIGFILVLIAIYRRQLNLIRNLKKPILFLNLSDGGNDLNIETSLLMQGGVYKKPKVTTDVRVFRSESARSVVILCVDDSTSEDTFIDTFTKMRDDNQPVIIYTFGNRQCELLNTQSQLIKSHTSHSLATTPIRLVGDLLALLSLK